MTALRCGRCSAVASDDEPFHISVSYTATADGTTTGIDQGDILVTWSQSGVMDRLLAVYVTCPSCDHTWRTRRPFATARPVAAALDTPASWEDVDTL